jgi:hypothetical protein
MIIQRLLPALAFAGTLAAQIFIRISNIRPACASEERPFH